jgi:hypothetical protein
MVSVVSRDHVSPSSLPGGVAGQAYADDVPRRRSRSQHVCCDHEPATGHDAQPARCAFERPQTGASRSRDGDGRNHCTGSVVALVTIACGSVASPASLSPGRVGDAYVATLRGRGVTVLVHGHRAARRPFAVHGGSARGNAGDGRTFMVTVSRRIPPAARAGRTCSNLSRAGCPADPSRGVFGPLLRRAVWKRGRRPVRVRARLRRPASELARRTVFPVRR